MGSLSEAMDEIVGAVAERFPKTIGVYTQTQAATFPFAQTCIPLGSGLDLSLYDFCPQPGPDLCWLGRIAPEKALEDAVAAIAQTGMPLKVMGQMQDPDYLRQIQQQFPEAPVSYLGFFETAEMQRRLGQCRALIVTPRWVEAFGNVLIEALACGVPVIAYARGGPTEIIREGETGWLVEPDSVKGLVDAIHKIDLISRHACRQQAEMEYSLPAYGQRLQNWLFQMLQR
jgi:UDP-glucose:tetrahydrobiopterin glucosyltransferase